MSRSRRIPHRCAGYVRLPNGTRVRCLKRKAMRMRWFVYPNPPRCPQCGSRAWWIDEHRRTRKDRKPCRCNGALYPHRPGSLAYCEMSKAHAH